MAEQSGIGQILDKIENTYTVDNQAMANEYDSIANRYRTTITVNAVIDTFPKGGDLDVVEAFSKGGIYSSMLLQSANNDSRKVLDDPNKPYEERLAVVQEALKSEGLVGLASDLGDKTLSKEEFIAGISESGHASAAKEQEKMPINPDLKEKISQHLQNSGIEPNEHLVNGLVLFEQHTDKMHIETAERLAADARKTNPGQFNSSANGDTLPKESTEGTSILEGGKTIVAPVTP